MHHPYFIITGTPKSGMAVLSGCLRIMEWNVLKSPSGMDASVINAMLLKDLGLADTWMTSRLPDGWIQSNAAGRARERIVKLIDSAQGVTSVPAFMIDSLFVLTWPLWRQVFQDKGEASHTIYMIRHPYEVVCSINENDHLDSGQLHMAWLSHVRHFLRGVTESDCYILTYDQLLADPVNALTCFFPDNEKKLSLSDSSTYDRYSRLLNFVQTSMKHHHSGHMEKQEQYLFTPFYQYYYQIRKNAAENKLFPFSRQGESDHYQGNDFDLLDAVLLQAIVCSSRTTLKQNKSKIEKGIVQPKKKELINQLEARIFYDSSQKELQELGRFNLIENQWQKIAVPLIINQPSGNYSESIIIQPLNTNGMVTVSKVELLHQATGRVLQLFDRFGSHETLNGVEIESDALRLPDKDNLLLLIIGDEPKVMFFFDLKNISIDCPVQFKIWLKAEQSQRDITKVLNTNYRTFNACLDNAFVEKLNKLGEDLYSEEKYKDAAELFKIAFELRPDSAWYCQNLAEAVARVNFNNHQVWQSCTLLESIKKWGKWDVAVRLYRKALKIDPKIVYSHQKKQSVKVFTEDENAVKNPIFIIGCGHSGTSLMLALLGAHPNLYPVPKESALFLNTDSVIQKKMTEFDMACEKDKKIRWIEKTPPHIFQIQRFLSFRPQSKFILMLRDGRDVVCSLKFRIGYADFSDRLDRWIYDNLAGQLYWDHPQVKVVKYEDLVTDSEGTLRDVCHFLNEDYSAQMLDYHKKELRWYSDKIVKPDEVKTHADHNTNRNWQINQPIFDGRGRWLKEMSELEKMHFKQSSSAQQLLEKFGYIIDRDW